MAERVEDLNLPNAVVTRIMRDCLPEGISVAKEARTAVARAASVFVLYLTSSANSAAVQASRKTISANDVFNALEETNFEFFVPPLKEALEGFKKSQQDKKLKMATNAAIKKKDEEAKSSESDVQHREEESEAVGIQEDADDMIEEVEDNE